MSESTRSAESNTASLILWAVALDLHLRLHCGKKRLPGIQESNAHLFLFNIFIYSFLTHILFAGSKAAASILLIGGVTVRLYDFFS